MDKMPPIGIMPRDIWEQRRFYEVREAILRYIRDEFVIPAEWIEEYNKLIKSHKS